MNVQVKTSDGRIYDATVQQSATIADLQSALFSPHPVPKNASIMARTRLLDPRERVSNVMHNDLFLVGPKPDVVKKQYQQQQQQQQQPQYSNNNSYQPQQQPNYNNHQYQQPSPQQQSRNNNNNYQQQQANPYTLGGNQQQSPQSRHHHHHHHGGHGHHHHHNNQQDELHHAKEAVSHLQDFVASPQGNGQQAQFKQPPPPPHFHPPQSPSSQQQQQQYQQQYQQHHHTPPPNQQYQKTATTPQPINSADWPKDPRKLLTFIRERFEIFNQQVQSPDVTPHDKLLIGELSMKLLYKLDELIDIDAELKAERKQLVKDIQQMQDRVDKSKQ